MKTALWKLSTTCNPTLESSIARLLSVLSKHPPAIWTDAETQLTTVSVFLPKRPTQPVKLKTAIASAIATLPNGTTLPRPKITLRRVPPQDWSESWKRHFRPIRIGAKLRIVPTWIRAKERPGEIIVRLDPGLSFGTGHHATTRYCLEQLTRFRPTRTPKSFCDLGTGSGILAIAAARLGYTPVFACDFDPECVRSTAENADLNGVGTEVVPRKQDVAKLSLAPRQKHHVVAANLMHDLLIRERDRISSQCRPDGILLLAGILVEQFEAVARAYRELGWTEISRKTRREWTSGTFKRNV